jgi:cyclic dehypoxanthinyl futalosine synthase
LDQIRDAISELGFTPRQRNVFYELHSPEHEQRAVVVNRQKSPSTLVSLRVGGKQPLIVP